MYQIRRFIRKVKKILLWIPIVWRDEDYDDFYIYEILKTKLITVAEYLSKKHELSYIGQERDAEIVNTCIRLIDRIQTDFYELEFAEHYNFDVEYNPVPGTSTYKLEFVNEDYSKMPEYFAKNTNLYKRVKREFENENAELDTYRIGLMISVYKQQKARELLFKLMSNNISKWWI